MLKRILNTGVSDINDVSLNRKIRMSNLIAVISIITMISFLPLAIYLRIVPSICLIIFFTTASFSNLIFHSYKKHFTAFYVYTTCGFIYFIVATLTFGLVSNLEFFMITMSLITAVLFDNKTIIKIFITIAIAIFFALRWYLKDKTGFINLPSEFNSIQERVGNIVLFLLFITTSIFFIFFKNENLNFQKAILHQKEIIEEKNKDITASITYAKRLQEAILPSNTLIHKTFFDSFVFYRPKDIVAGDFYWLEQTYKNPELIFFAAADCTGHGVPGAMVSVVCSNALNRTIKEFGITEPGEILDKVRELVVETFVRKDSFGEKNNSDVQDGMDISLFSLNDSKKELKWAGANNPMLIIRNNQITEYKPNKQPIGKVDNAQAFITHTIALEKGDTVYTFTDGLADQFGGPKGKKFKYARLKEILVEINQLPMSKQIESLDKELSHWMGDLEQVDDILVAGIRI